MASQPFLRRVIDDLSFQRIFTYWILMILGFGMLYSMGNDYILDKPDVTLAEGMFFSFGVAGAGGRSDLSPVGMGNVLVIIETIVSLLTYAVAISKLLSYKQAIILQEVYEISFQEKITRLRSMLNLFRSDLNNSIEKMHEEKVNPSTIKESGFYFHTFANTMEEIHALLYERSESSHYVKKVGFATFELMLTSIIISIDKALEFFTLARKKSIPLSKIHYALSVATICSVGTRIVQTYKDLDYEKIKSKLAILETLTKSLRAEVDSLTK